MPIRLGKMSSSTGTDSRPTNWDKRVAAAYLRLLGMTQAASAKGVGVSKRTLIRWEQDQSWHDATAEAASRWMNAAVDEARRCVMQAVQAGDAATARWLLERLEPALAPPSQNHQLHTTGVRIDLIRDEPVKRDLEGWMKKHSGITDPAAAVMDSDPECRAARDEINRMIADRVAAQKPKDSP